MVNFNKFDWVKIFNVVASTNTLKRNQMRPLRTEIIELAVSKYSDGQLQYIGDTTNGCDFLDDDGVRYECKSRDSLFSKSRSGYSKEIILKNFYRKTDLVYEQTFDHLIMLDTVNNIVAVCDHTTAIKNSNITDSIITTKILLEDLKYVVKNVLCNNIFNFEYVLKNLISENI